MQQSQEKAPERRALTVISAFLSKHRKTFAIVLGALAIGVVGLFVFLSIRNNRLERSYAAVDELQTAFSEWSGLDDTEREDRFEELSAQANRITETYPRLYAAARAILIRGDALVELERYAEAADAYVEVADRFPDTYLAPRGLMKAAVAAENGGDVQQALSSLLRLVDEYDEESPDTPRALLSIGRIYESLDDIAEAEHYYNVLIDDYPTSSWTNLARTRIITLTAQGRIGSS
jgi:tetratricopeptide (TPR) repeat protein